MAPGLPRTRFNSSTLVQLLAELDTAEAAHPTHGVAEKLVAWLGWTDAIALSSALKQGGAAAPRRTPFGAHWGKPKAGATQARATDPATALTQELTRVRHDLARAITTDDVLSAPTASTAGPPASAAVAPSADFAPYRRAYQAQQRAMEARISPLRARLRTALAAQSPALGRLAALDAVLDDALLERERHLLAKVPALLEGHFERQRRALADAAAEADAATNAAGDADAGTAGALGQPAGTPGPTPSPTAGWHARCSQTLQSALRAELDLRLQPVQGLMLALRPQALPAHE